jgi:elongation factor G
MDPIEIHAESWKDTAFESVVMGRNMPRNYIPADEKGFYEAHDNGPLSGNSISGARMVLRNSEFHGVDSSEIVSLRRYRCVLRGVTQDEA